MIRTFENSSPELKDLLSRVSLQIVETHELSASRVAPDQPIQFRVSLDPGLAPAEGCVNFRVALACEMLAADEKPVAQLNATVVGLYSITEGASIAESTFQEFGPIALQEIYVYARQQVYDLAARIGVAGFVLNDIGRELEKLNEV